MTSTVDFRDIQYIDLTTAKKWLNIDEAFEDDDMLIYGLIDAAQAATERYLDVPLESIERAGVIPSAIKQAMLYLIGTWYAQRESISSSSSQMVPHTFELLCDLYRNYDYRDAITKTEEE